MTTFAETVKPPVADGQNYLENYPQEMAFYGFVPPIRTPKGGMTKGDSITVQWWNTMLRDVFRAQKQTQAFDVPGTGAMTVKIGPLTLSVMQINGTASAGSVTFPTAFKNPPIVLLTDESSTATGLVIGTVAASVTTTGFKFRVRKADGTEDTTNFGGTLQAFVIGESTGTPPPSPVYGMFAEYPRTYEDGQASWVSPSADQWDKGFEFIHKDAAGKIIQGEQLPANVLNFIFCDLFRKGGRGVVTSKGYVIQSGALKIQFWKEKVLSGGDRFTFPEPFRQGSTPFVNVAFNSLTQSGAISTLGGAYAGLNTLDPAQSNIRTGRVIAWDSAVAPVSIDADVVLYAVGMADRPDSLQRYYSSFAGNDRTYPDGAINKRNPAAGIMAGGYAPRVLNTDGTYSGGDLFYTQDINGLLNAAYVDAAATLTPIGGQLVESVSANGWSGVENSKFWIASKLFTGLTAASWPAGVFTTPYPFPIKAGSKTISMASDVNEGTPSVIATSDGTDTNATFRAYSYKTPAISGAPASIRVFMIGQKP